jgi:hypothetical protein
MPVNQTVGGRAGKPVRPQIGRPTAAAAVRVRIDFNSYSLLCRRRFTKANVVLSPLLTFLMIPT